VVERYVRGTPRRKSWALTPEGRREAIAWAKRWHATPVDRAVERSVREIGQAYFESPRFQALRPRTRTRYRDQWERFVLRVKPETGAEAVTLHTLDQLWSALGKAGVAPNQIAGVIGTVRRVYRFAQSRKLIQVNDTALWERPTGTRRIAKEIPEYTPDECDRIVATLRPQDGRVWRFAAVFLFAAEHGFRSNAILHLRWEDVDLERGTVTMPAAWDKQHETHERPLTWGALSALLTAKHWRERLGYAGPWVFFSGQPARRDEPWSYQAANLALLRAERTAGVPHVKWRAFHGVRRTTAGNVRQATGDPVLGMLWIGDRDLKQAGKYIKQRQDELQAIADREPR